SQKVDVRVRPRPRNWIGGAKSYRYRVVAHDPDTPPAELDAALTQRPLIPGWVVALAAVVAPLLAALVAFLMLWTTVPDLEGLDAAGATERLEEAGLEAAVARQHTSRAAAGKVLGTEPEAGARIRKGSKVKVFVSAGPRPVPIPNVVGLDEATARLELTGMGFVIEEVAEGSEEVEPGLVISTRPAANLLVPPGSKVQMVVAEPPEPEKGAAGAESEKKEGEDGAAEDGGEDENGAGEAGADEDAPPAPYWTSSIASSDFDGDGDADPAVFRPSTGAWHVRPAPGENAAVDWARQRGNDIPVPGDYDGDAVADFATWRPSDATWYVRSGDSLAHEIVEFGKPGDIPVPADYDGDGITDRAVFGAEDGRWRIDPSSGDDSAVREIEWGDRSEGDLPAPADYDGDGKADLAFYRPATGRWNVSFSGGGRDSVAWGNAEEGDIPVAGDYTGDGRADYAVWRPSQGEWRVNPSGRGANVFVTWGRRDLLDVPVPGDYTGDGTFDYTVWRESTRAWRVLPAEGKRHRVHYWGREGDVPV
ncbi:MAG TPA: PASTA domain-containing protein, partial [Actinomycetota bacterium]|nr:PASTA domain-containing protein [Actinomycetota bacterium]